MSSLRLRSTSRPTCLTLFCRYITRKDKSPLMNALVVWRESAIRNKLQHISSRSTSPASGDDRERLEGIEEQVPWAPEKRPLKRSSSDMTATAGSEGSNLSKAKPSSSSWVLWWRTGRNERPDLRSMTTTALPMVHFSRSFTDSMLTVRLGEHKAPSRSLPFISEAHSFHCICACCYACASAS